MKEGEAHGGIWCLDALGQGQYRVMAEIVKRAQRSREAGGCRWESRRDVEIVNAMWLSSFLGEDLQGSSLTSDASGPCASQHLDG